MGSSSRIRIKSTVPASTTNELLGLCDTISVTVASSVGKPLQVTQTPPSCPATYPPTFNSSKSSQFEITGIPQNKHHQNVLREVYPSTRVCKEINTSQCIRSLGFQMLQESMDIQQ